MKTTRKLLACLMVVVMLASMFCVGAGAINIDGIDGVTYTIYKVFDTEGDSENAILYVWPYSDALKDTFSSHLTTTNTADGNKYVKLTTNTEAGAVAFAEAVIANKASFTVAATGTGDFTPTPALDDGYYVMANDTNNTVVAFSVIGGKVLAGGTYSGDTITAKGGLPTLNKTVDDSNNIVAIGQTLTYTITVEAEKNAINYVVTDVIPAGLKNVTLSTITRNGTNITTALAGKTTVSDSQIKVDFTEYLATPANATASGDTFVITYTAVVDTDATIGSTGNINEVTLTYGASKTMTDSVTVYTSQISFTKYITDTTTPLAGAEFVLKKGTDAYAKTITDGVVTAWGTEAEAQTITTGTTEIIIKGLDDGTYTFVETNAPNGYTIVNKETSVTIGTNPTDASFTPAMANIYNAPGKPLPETGGIGTTVFYAAGGILVLGALVVLLMKKRTVTE